MLRFALLLVVIAAGCAPLKRPQAAGLKTDTAGRDRELDGKLGQQWERYDQARAFLLNEVVVKKSTVTRDQWEEQLALTGDYAFSAADIVALRERHLQVAAASQAQAAARSKLNLDKLRAGGDIEAFCHDFPKGGLLHIHPYGTLDRTTVAKILEQVNPVIPFAKLKDLLNSPGGTGTLYPTELAQLGEVAARYSASTKFKKLSTEDQAYVIGLFFLPSGNHPFDRFTAVFTTISALIFSNNAVDPEPLQWEGFLSRARDHRVRYVEVSRFIIPKASWFQSLDAWAQSMEETYGVTVRLRAAFARNKELPFTRTKVEQLLGFPASNVLTGVDFLADETAYPALEFGQTLYAPLLYATQAGTSKIRRTGHAGELGDARNVRDMMIMGAERVGHGVKLQEDPVALEYARLHEFPIEINIVSNKRLKVIENVAEHPFLLYLRLGLRVSLSTDDEGIFESTIDDECIAAVKDTDINYDELKRLSFNSIETSFADAETKAKLLAVVEDDFVIFEAAWPALVY